MLVEVKSGETYNGHLVNCDTWMNINLKEVIITSANGERFWKLPECYIRGNTIKYIRIPEEILDAAKEDNRRNRGRGNAPRGAARGGRGGRGGGSTMGGRGGHSGGGRGGRGGNANRSGKMNGNHDN